jgi:hypothetical protein
MKITLGILLGLSVYFNNYQHTLLKKSLTLVNKQTRVIGMCELKAQQDLQETENELRRLGSAGM